MYIFTPNTLIKSNEVNANFTELKAKTDYLTTPDANWVVVAANGNPQPSFMNGWVNYNGGYQTAAFYKDALGIVHLKGLVTGGTFGAETAIFQLPVGYRPSLRLLIANQSNQTIGRVDVRADGYVIANVGSGWFSLDNIHFKAEQ